MTNPLLIECQQLSIGYDGRALLPPIDFRIEAGEFWVLLGPNGAGKSTLLKTLLGLHTPLSGVLLRPPGTRVTYLEQRSMSDAIYPVRVSDMLTMGWLRGLAALNPFRRPGRAQMLEVLKQTGVDAFIDRPFRDLSEGQKQRVLISRGLMSEATLMVLDEPTASLDAVGELDVLDRLNELNRERKMGLIVVTHFLEVAPRFDTNVLYLDNHFNAVISGAAEQVFESEAFRHRYGDQRRLLTEPAEQHCGEATYAHQ